MQYFIEDFVDSRPDAKVILEESQVKGSGSNFIVERGVQSIEGHMRALYSALQDGLGCNTDAEGRILAYVLEYAAHLMNSTEIGKRLQDCL